MTQSSDQLKALTFIHFPFTERSFSPGEMIDRSEFEEYAAAAAAAVPVHDDERGGHVPTADEMIDLFVDGGSVSEDPDAPLHKDHVPVDPASPTLDLLIKQAKDMVATLEEHGQEVPDELRKLSETNYTSVVANGDAGGAGESNAG